MAGKVYLVGSGPGDPELMAKKSERVLSEADVVLHDTLIGEEIKELLPEISAGEIIDCGKRKGKHKFTQKGINELLVKRASSGDTVVRLKGGDPFVFGRGGEEVEVLRDNGLEVEVVPGITSAIAAPTVAGIPLTERTITSHFTVVTGHEDPTKEDSGIDWKKLAKFGGTLVVLMGITKLEDIANTLIKGGRDPSTPVATIEQATLPGQKVVIGNLENIAARIRDADIKPPGTTIIGDVVGVSEEFHE